VKWIVNTALLIAFFAVGAAGFFLRKKAARTLGEDASKKQKSAVKRATALMIVGAWLAFTWLLRIAFGPYKGESIEIDLWAARTDIFGFSVSMSAVYTWIIMAVVLAAALVLRFTVLNKMNRRPRGAQNVLELTVEKLLSYMNSSVHGLGGAMGAYLFTIAVLLTGCACLEMFGYRTPASDPTFTVALAVMTFLIINWYGVRKKGVKTRLKYFRNPINIITSLAIPMSLACRLFGNMLGGMIIMDLLYSALGANALGIPSVFGLFFNVFHPLLQAFIFITLSLSFIREAVE
jgi:F-type H+-transporting ATPase subunit a